MTTTEKINNVVALHTQFKPLFKGLVNANKAHRAKTKLAEAIIEVIADLKDESLERINKGAIKITGNDSLGLYNIVLIDSQTGTRRYDFEIAKMEVLFHD